MDKKEDLLTEIYQGAKMGDRAIQALLPKTENLNFRSDLEKQGSKYCEIAKEAGSRLKNRGKIPEGPKMAAQIGLQTSLGLHTFMNKETSHLAELVINGSVMGITSLTKTVNTCGVEERYTKELADQLLKAQQDSIENMKRYLS